MRIDLVTALPDILESPLDQSIIRRARVAGLVDIQVHDLREHAHDRHRQVDDYQFGGGAGMVLKPEPLFECVEGLLADGQPIDEVIFLTPDGEQLTLEFPEVPEHAPRGEDGQPEY